ncbi:MAG TPA: DMT family transporter [Cycloclasticus sp.]|jgi:drug/metabolite transporter (DMT)-like permease|nr:DMT family transporter [Cycloclasticus sp.]HIL92318.1 DMT family transporter [Cycloclasticus sp.]
MINLSLSTLITRWAPLVFVLLWSTGFIGAKFALPYIEPFNLLFIRMLATLVVFAVLIKIFRANKITPAQAAHQMVVGSLVHAAYLGGVFAAIKLEMPAGLAALLVGLQPLLTALMGLVFLSERLNFKQWLGLLLGLFGVCIVLLQGQDLSQITLSGAALIAVTIALFGISIGTMYQKRFGVGVNLLTGSFFQYLATAIWMGLLTFSFEQQQITWHPHLIGALLWLVFGLSIIAILLLMHMIHEGKTTQVASYFYLVPPVTAIEAWWLFGETLTPFAIGGMFIAIYGVYLVIKQPA